MSEVSEALLEIPSGLNLVPFNDTEFNRTHGHRLRVSGLGWVATLLFERSEEKKFLPDSGLTDDMSLLGVNADLLYAKEAQRFQDKLKNIPIKENYQKLTNLETIGRDRCFPWEFSDNPYHEACKEWAGKRRLFSVREQVAQKLIDMTYDLQTAHYGIRFEDAFRPPDVQRGLFYRRYQQTKQNNTNWSDEEILLETKSKTAYTPRFAAHQAGAAVDIRLIDTITGEIVDIGHDYPDGGSKVAVSFPFVTQTQWLNRNLLAVVAGKHGLTMYPFEDWHVSAGDVTSVVLGGETQEGAVFGPIKSFDLTTGEAIDTYGSEELDVVFPLNL